MPPSKLQPQAPIDFGVTNGEYVRRAYQGKDEYQKDGPMKNLRAIARIESPAYLMIAATRASGITDLRQIAALDVSEGNTGPGVLNRDRATESTQSPSSRTARGAAVRRA